MKNEKTQSYTRRQNRVNKIELPKSKNTLSPKQEKKYTNNKSPKKDELYPNDLLENTRKYLEMSNGNNNYFISPISPKIDYNKFTSPSFSEDYNNIAKKYNDNYEYDAFSPTYISDEIDNDNGNEKLHRVKDEYIEYLQRQLDENNKNVIRLESKLNELQKKFKSLIDDNRILNDTLNERTNKLNEFLQENENLRLQINNYIDNETKYKIQLQYYEKQIGLYETNINDYNNIINDLKVSNEKLTNNLSQNLDKNKKTESTNNYNNYNYFNVRNINNNEGELQLIKNQNMIYANDIKSKDYTIELMTKKNQKLTNENKIYKSQIHQYAQQISNLYNILKQKNKIITIYRQKEGFTDNSLDVEFEKKLEELNLNFLNNNELLLDISKDDTITNKYNYENINANNNDKLTKLLSDNEQNRKKIDILNNKIKSLNQFDTKSVTKKATNNKSNNNNNNNILSNTNNINNNNNKILISKNLNSSNNNNNINMKSPPKKENGESTNNAKFGNSWRILVSPKKKEEKEIEIIKIGSKDKSKEEIINTFMMKRNFFKERREQREQREREKEKEKEKEKAEENNENNGNNKNNEDNNKNEEQNDNDKPEEKKEKKKANGKPKKHVLFKGLLDEKEEMKETVREMGRKKNLSHVPKTKKKFRISDFLDVTEINTSSPVAPQNLSFSMDDTEYINNLINSSSNNSIYLFGIDRDDFFYIFDLKDRRFNKKKILEIEDISDTFQKDYQYEGTILYNTLDGIFILTGKKSDILYYYNPKYDTINKICKFNNSHDNGSLLLDKEYNRLFVFGGKETVECEYYSFNDKKLYTVPELTTDRANASFTLCGGKIYGFFGFSYKKNKYCGSVEIIDHKKLDKWSEVKNIKILNDKISFDVESVSTISYKEDNNKILLYAGIQGDNEDYVIDYYYLYDTKENTIDIIEKWPNKIMKYVGSRWRNSNLTKKDPAGYHFAKNSNFLKLSKEINIDGYDNDIYLLMDYKNNVHFIDQDQKTIDIFKSDI
jgi:hypothetical protein